LSFQTTSEALTTFLSSAGEIVDIHLPSDRESGRPRGFAFVEFSTEAEAAEAIKQFDGKELDGRALRVNEAEERPRREPRPRGGGGGYGGGGGGYGKRKPHKEKGSRRGIRRRKRSL
jgi:RNA recognition motif-containing protein